MSKISVSDKAQEYFLNIINKQKMEGLAIRLTASNVGTPGVQCGILYCPKAVSYTHLTLPTKRAV